MKNPIKTVLIRSIENSATRLPFGETCDESLDGFPELAMNSAHKAQDSLRVTRNGNHYLAHPDEPKKLQTLNYSFFDFVAVRRLLVLTPTTAGAVFFSNQFTDHQIVSS